MAERKHHWIPESISGHMSTLSKCGFSSNTRVSFDQFLTKSSDYLRAAKGKSTVRQRLQGPQQAPEHLGSTPSSALGDLC